MSSDDSPQTDASVMDRAGMISMLDEYGADASSDYNDSEFVDGWFGWRVEGGRLTVTFTPSLDNGDAGVPVSRVRQLVPVMDDDE